jgi:hypothetical protein
MSGARSKGAEESAFLAGEIGVDGQATEEARDEVELEQAKAAEDLTRGRTYLGREFFAWVIHRTNSTEPLVVVDDEPVTALCVGGLTLRGLTGDATEIVLKGTTAAYSRLAREAMIDGLLPHVIRLRLSHGEKVYEATIDAEHLAVRSAKLPALLSEAADDKITERLFLAETLSRIVDAAFRDFLTLRASPRWSAEVVPELRAWMFSEHRG